MIVFPVYLIAIIAVGGCLFVTGEK